MKVLHDAVARWKFKKGFCCYNFVAGSCSVYFVIVLDGVKSQN